MECAAWGVHVEDAKTPGQADGQMLRALVEAVPGHATQVQDILLHTHRLCSAHNEGFDLIDD